MKLTQCEKIVEYMNEHGSITQLDAYKLGCMRLPSRIHDLRKQGYAINVKTERVKKADGGYAPIARYSLQDDAENGNI
jgi:hypothetical protein